MTRRDVFQAIADPTRRRILGAIAAHPMNVTAVAEKFPVSRVAISKHLKILEECGLVVVRQQGRERICQAQLDGLREISEWVEAYRRYWDARLDRLELYLNSLQQNKKRSHGKKS